jgi:hypothetical protein
MNKLELLLNKAIFVQKQINSYKELKQKRTYKNLDGMIILEENPMMDFMEEQEKPHSVFSEEDDWEGGMALTELAAIIDKATTVRRLISPNSELPAWLQSKITMASHDITAIHDYIKYRNQ